MMTLHTVAAATLEAEAARICEYADRSMPAWVIVGEGDRYAEVMAQARALRRAASIRGIAARRDYLRDAGFSV